MSDIERAAWINSVVTTWNEADMPIERRLEEALASLAHARFPDGAATTRDLAEENQRLRDRLGPRGLEVVEIDGAGHYVNEKVRAEIEKLRRENDHGYADGVEWATMHDVAQSVEVPRLSERMTDVVMMLDNSDCYNREYIAAVCRSILSSISPTETK